MSPRRKIQSGVCETNNASIFSSCFLGVDLPGDAAEILLGKMETCFFSEGHQLWLAKSEVEFLAVVHTGLVRMTRTAPQGSEVVVEILGPGDCVGMFAAMGYPHYPLNAWAVLDTWCLKIPTAAWKNAWDSSPRLREQVASQLAPRLLESYDFLATMLCGSVEQRLARIVLKLSDKNRMILGLSHAAIADLAHTTVETCIRTTSKWQEKGWLVKGYRSLTVVQPDMLRAILQPIKLSRA